MEQSVTNSSQLTTPSRGSAGSHSQIDVTILRAENLPRLKTFFGRKRKFYVLVSNGVTTKRTEAPRSVAQAVQWNERLATLDVASSSNVEFTLLSRKTIGGDILVGRQQLPCESQSEVAFSLGSSDGSSGRVTVYLTIDVSTKSSSSEVAVTGTSNTGTSEQDNVAPRVPASQTTKDPEGTTQPTDADSRLPKGSVEDSPPPQPEAAHAEISPENTLDETEEALKGIHTSDTWKGAVKNTKWVMEHLAPLASLHPYAQLAFDLLSGLPRPFLKQFERDEYVEALFEAIRDGFDLAQEAEGLKRIKPRSKQAQILTLMIKHVVNVSDFIRTYVKDTTFRERFLKNITGKADGKIHAYRAALDKYRHDLLDHAVITTEINTFQILDDVGVISTNVRSISDQLELVSRKVSDMDLNAKIDELPYKGGWRSDVKRDYLPGTRAEFLDYIIKWTNNPDTERGLILFGPAGTGKSSIVYEIARRFREMNRLTSYFVFLRKEQARRKDYLLFTTIIHDLATRYPSFKTALGAAIGNNKSLRAVQDYETLFKELLLEPLQDLHIVGPIVVVIDALDESGDATGEDGLHTFLAKSISRLPSQFRILMTSRQEKAINDAFSAAESVRIVKMTDSVLSATTGKDIRAYLQVKLDRIPELLEEHGKSLESKAEGLFQWAAVACGYIRNPPPGFTINQCIKNLLHPSSNTEGLPLLDHLYKDILEGYFKSSEVRPRFRSVMGQLLAAFEPLSITSLTSLRRYAPHADDLDDQDVSAIVSHLGSLLTNVTSSYASLPIVPLHTSFRDFLTDKSKSGEFYIDLKQAHDDLAHCCLGLILDKLEFNICKLESSYVANKDVADIDDRIEKNIPAELSYACQMWDDHLENVDFNDDLFGKLQTFFYDKFLFWLEVLSITGDVGIAPLALSIVKKWLASDPQKLLQHSRSTTEEFEAFIDDAFTFVRHFGMPIARSAPHIYLSCLPFAPVSSHVSKHYSTKFPHTLSLQRGQLSHWPALEMAMQAHESQIFSVSFSPRGQRIASGSNDHTVRVWNSTTGELIGKPSIGHSGAVFSVSFSPDGRHVVSGSDDRTIRIWNTATGGTVGKPFIGHDGAVFSVAFSPDGRHVVSGSDDHTIRLWDAATGEMVGKPFVGHSCPVYSVSYSPDGQRIISGSGDHTIRIWNASGGMVGEPLVGHDGEVLSVSFSPHGRHIASGSADRTIRVWDVAKGEMVGEPFTEHKDAVLSVSFSPDGHYVVSGSKDSTILAWNAGTGEMLGKLFSGDNNPIRSISFSPDGQRIVSGSDDPTICVWSATVGKMTGKPFSGYQHSVPSLSFSPDGRYVVSGSSGYKIHVWDAVTGEMVGKPFEGHSGRVLAVALSSDGQRITSGSEDHTVRVWDVKTGEMVGKPLVGHDAKVLSVSFSPDGLRIVSGSKDHTIRVWDVTSGETVGKPLIGHGGTVSSVSFSHDGQHVVSGSNDHSIRLWNVATGEMVGKPFTGHSGSVSSVIFSPDRQHVVSGSDDRTVRVWDLTTGEMVGKPFDGHTDGVCSISCSPDGQHIASGSRDRTVCVWNVATGEMMRKSHLGHDGMVFSISFSPDGRRVALGGFDRTIRLCDIAEEELEADKIDHFTDDSTIDSEGWIYGKQGELFLWVPLLHRLSLHRPKNVWIVGEHATLLDFSNFVHGRNWAELLH